MYFLVIKLLRYVPKYDSFFVYCSFEGLDIIIICNKVTTNYFTAMSINLIFFFSGAKLLRDYFYSLFYFHAGVPYRKLHTNLKPLSIFSSVGTGRGGDVRS